MNQEQPPTVRRDGKKPEPLELVAASIVKLADGIDQMKKSGLTERGIKVLLNDVTGVPKCHIEAILNAGPWLRKALLK
jgi:NurA-like 5'-3' nuclease